MVEGIAKIGFPFPSKERAAPLKKSTCPPNPKKTNKMSLKKLLEFMKSSIA